MGSHPNYGATQCAVGSMLTVDHIGLILLQAYGFLGRVRFSYNQKEMALVPPDSQRENCNLDHHSTATLLLVLILEH